jgi:hypothetical protein
VPHDEDFLARDRNRRCFLSADGRSFRGAFAQTAAPAAKDAAPAAAAAKAPKEAKPHTAESIECSKEADAKGLHGKERKKFRSECKKEKSGGAAAAPAGTK